MTEAVAGLTRAAFEVMGLGYVEVQCDPNNGASTRVAEKAGFVHIETLPANKLTPRGASRDTMVWTMVESACAGSPAGSTRIRASYENGDCALDAY